MSLHTTCRSLVLYQVWSKNCSFFIKICKSVLLNGKINRPQTIFLVKASFVLPQFLSIKTFSIISHTKYYRTKKGTYSIFSPKDKPVLYGWEVKAFLIQHLRYKNMSEQQKRVSFELKDTPFAEFKAKKLIFVNILSI